MSGVQRTSYKKGPPVDPYRSPIRNNFPGQNRGYPDYDYYSDPFGSFADSAYQNNKMGRDRMPHFRDSPQYYPTTPRYKINRNNYRGRSPSSSRRADRFQGTNNGNEKSVPGMKAKRGKRYVEQLFYSNDKTENALKNEQNIPQKSSSRHSKLNFKNRKRKQDEINLKRKRRHVGPHDEDGLQRLLSTGSLAPSSLPKNNPFYNNSIDFVFATYWFFPAKTQAILPQDQKCIEEKMAEEKQRFDPKSKSENFE